MNHRLAALIQQHNDGITFDDGFFEDVEGVQAFLNVRRGAISFAVVLQHAGIAGEGLARAFFIRLPISREDGGQGIVIEDFTITRVNA